MQIVKDSAERLLNLERLNFLVRITLQLTIMSPSGLTPTWIHNGSYCVMLMV